MRRKGERSALFELRVTVPEGRGDEASALLIGEGAGGLVEEAHGRQVRLVTYGDERALARLGRVASRALAPRVRVQVRPAPPSLDGWDTAWMDALEPVAISRTLMLVPTTRTIPTGLRASIVRLEPALAFGFGEHPTTRLAARAVERSCRAGGAPSVLDVGTGSGVLALVAAVSGAGRVVGIDIDANAVRAAKRNAALNGVERLCRFSATPLERIRAEFDLVVANVDRGTVLGRARSLGRLVRRGGTLLLTGFLSGDARDVEACYAALGLTPRGRKREGAGGAGGAWVLVTLRRP